MLKTPFRYPGGKTRLAAFLLERLNPLLKTSDVYVEPFVGGGSVALAVAEAYPSMRIVINDLNYSVYAFWSVVAEGSDDEFSQLTDMLYTEVSIEQYYNLRAREAGFCSRVESAYMALYFNRTSFSGILHAGPIGGASQNSRWKVGCRFNDAALVSRMKSIRTALLGRTVVLNRPAADLMRVSEGTAYLDPPYYRKGKELYQVYMKEEEHAELASVLKGRGGWLLSYDSCREVEQLYSGCSIEEVPTRYSINGKKTEWNSKTEVLISPARQESYGVVR